MKPKSSARWAIAIVAGASVLFGLGAVASYFRGNDAVTSVQVGDCLANDPNSYRGEGVDKVRIVGCSDPHYMEVFHEVQHTEAKLPETSELVRAAEAECMRNVPRFASGIDLDMNLQVFMFTPTSISWATGDRVTSCLLFRLDEAGERPQQISGSFFDPPPTPED